MAAATQKITPRLVMREVLGKDTADNMIADIGMEWTLLATVCAIDSRGGPANERERMFMAWADRVTSD